MEIKLNVYKIIHESVERAVEHGYHRAFKYTESPDSHTIKNEIYQAVMNELCDIINFDTDETN